jgi:hypothetical protein
MTWYCCQLPGGGELGALLWLCVQQHQPRRALCGTHTCACLHSALQSAADLAVWHVLEIMLHGLWHVLDVMLHGQLRL